MLIKFLNPDGSSHYDPTFKYPLPTLNSPGERIEAPGPHPTDSTACGPNRLHVCHKPYPCAGAFWGIPYEAEGRGLIGKDALGKSAYRKIRLIRLIPRSELLYPGADLRDACLSKANLSGANLSGAHRRGADLRWANLRGADLRKVDLRKANLRGADFRGTDLTAVYHKLIHLRSTSYADFGDANLSSADLRGVNLSEANLYGVNLSDAKLSSADLSRANLCGATLQNVDPSGVNWGIQGKPSNYKDRPS